MGFSLTIQEGKDSGRQYAFDQPEVTIGRTAENDVVLYDPGVSRRHVVIRCESGRFFVQDMGSANGTQVNGNPVTEEELQTGDLVSVGPVIFAFEVLEEGAASTRLISPAPARKGPAGRSSTAQLKSTAPIQAASRRPNLVARQAAPPPAARASGASAARASGANPARQSTALARSGRSGGVPAARPKPQQAPMLASERARLRRQHAGPLGKLKIVYLEAPKPVRIGVLAAGALVVLLVLGLGVNAWIKGGTRGPIGPRDRSREIFKISDTASSDVYGYGEELGVTVETANELHFEFEYSESVPVAYYVRFEPMGIERKDEVEISLNGVHIGYANAAIGDYVKAQRVKLPKKYLKPGIPNELVFDNAYNPPHSEPWAIAKARLVIKPLPACQDRDDCMREAKKHIDKAEQLLAQKDIAAENRHLASVNLTRALLFLENVEPKPDMYSAAQGTAREVDREMEDICKKTFLEAKKNEEMGNQKKALGAYKAGLMFFPAGDDEHACRAQLKEKIEEYGDIGPGGGY